MVYPLWIKVWQFLIKVNIYLPHDPAVLLLGVYPREMKTYPQKYVYKNIHSSSNWKQPKCPSAEQVTWYAQTAEYYSTVKGTNCGYTEHG